MKESKYGLQDKHRLVVERLVDALNSKKYSDVARGRLGLYPLFFGIGNENRTAAYNNMMLLEKEFGDIRQEYLLTDNDLRKMTLYANLTSVELSKTTLFDYWSPAFMSFSFLFFSAVLIYQLEILENADQAFVYIVSSILVTFGAGMKAAVLRRRAATMKRAFSYSQIESLIKSALK